MDEARQTILAASRSLARLQMQLYRKTFEWRREPGKAVDKHPRWVVGDLDKPSPWLYGHPEGASLDGVIVNIAEAQYFLIAIAAGPDPVDRELACKAIHHAAGSPSAWGEPVLRFAARLGIKLASSPIEQFHASGLANDVPPGTRRGLRY